MSKVHESLRAGTNIPAINEPIPEAHPDGQETYLLRQAELQSVIDTLCNETETISGQQDRRRSESERRQEEPFSGIKELQQEVRSLKIEIEAMRDAMKKQGQENEKMIEDALLREAGLRLEVEQLKKRLVMAAAQLRRARQQGYLSYDS